jgi:hypothetical protein
MIGFSQILRAGVYPGNKTFKSGTNWRPNPTWKGGLNTTFTMGADQSFNSISFTDLSIVMTKSDVGYWINTTSGADLQVTVSKWFDVSSNTTETSLTFTGSGTYYHRIYVGSLGSPSTINGVSAWNYSANLIDFSVECSTTTVTLSWTGTVPPPPPPPPAPPVGRSTDLSLLWQYLLAGNFLGFVAASYTSLIGQLFYVIVAVLFTAPLYIRTKSLTLMGILWTLIGGVFITAMPIVSPFAILLTAMGIGALLFRLYQRE